MVLSKPCRSTILALVLFVQLLLWRASEGFVISRPHQEHAHCVPIRTNPQTTWRNKQSNGWPSSSTSLSASFPEALVDPLFLEHMATGGALAFAGDLIAQSLTNPKEDDEKLSFPPKDWDTTRTAALTWFGALYTGGAQHFIFGFLNAEFSEPFQRLLLAQFCFIPFCYYPTFLVMVPTLRAGFGPDAALERERMTNEVVSRLPATLLRNWCFWLPVQFVQFTFIPTDLQVTYCAAFGVIWNAILSWSTMQASSEESTNDR